MFLHFNLDLRPCTCIFLWSHWSIDDPLEGSYPFPLLRLRLASKQELPVWRDDGDAVVPVVALGGRRQAGQHRVAVLLTANEDLTTGVSVLWGRGGREGGDVRMIGQVQKSF